MSNWKDKTDFEINKAVAEIECTDAEDIPNECDAWTNNDTECQVIIKAGIDGFMFDPCNNPSDAWPIVIENNISLHHNYNCQGGVCEPTGIWEASIFEGDITCRNKNPLRAAMIAYLEINGVKP